MSGGSKGAREGEVWCWSRRGWGAVRGRPPESGRGGSHAAHARDGHLNQRKFPLSLVTLELSAVLAAGAFFALLMRAGG